MREHSLRRTTAETDIELRLALEGAGAGAESRIETGIGFFDHMLTLFARHGGFGLTLRCTGDLHVDGHHSVEDVGIALGTALRAALGEGRGIRRYGSMLLPMDEALALCALDISGRGMLVLDVPIGAERVGGFDTALLEEFLLAFARSAGITLHMRLLAGKNAHHIIEACFKALGRALKEAVSIDAARAQEIPSTKGVLL